MVIGIEYNPFLLIQQKAEKPLLRQDIASLITLSIPYTGVYIKIKDLISKNSHSTAVPFSEKPAMLIADDSTKTEETRADNFYKEQTRRIALSEASNIGQVFPISLTLPLKLKVIMPICCI